jgi:NitT/TauT family transport system substrate-binding protein
MKRFKWRNPRAAALVGLLVLLGACGARPAGEAARPAESAAAPASAARPAPPPAAAPAAPAASAPAQAQAPARPELTTSPPVNLTVGVLPTAVFGPQFIAQERGYFKDVGLNVELVATPSLTDQIASLIQGQIQVGGCASNIACFNALNRRADVQIVADLQSGGKTPKSTGNVGIVARKDLWDAGVIREPKDLAGRSVYLQGGEGGAPWNEAVRWLMRHNVDPRSVEWPTMTFPDVLAAMTNQAIEVGFQAEPLLSAGTARGVHQLLVTQEEMYPEIQALYLAYWTGIERQGPQVGERFMVAYLRGVRDYLNAFEHGVDQDAVIQIMIENTPIKDPAIYRQIKYTWIDPNGVLNRASLESDIQLLRDFGIAQTPIDLSGMFEDRYRQFAVRYLGEYQAPR